MASDSFPSLGELLRWGKERLKSAAIEDYNISAEVLLRDIYTLSRAELHTNLNIVPDRSGIEKYEEYIQRRSAREPLQYITGTTEFFNIIVKCDPRALIPRPETEILVEAVIDRLKGIKKPKILDIGTGSGNIAIALAKNIEDAEVVAVDISSDAIELARSNAELNDISERVLFRIGDIGDRGFIQSLGEFNCVASNPPYVSEDQKDIIQPEVIKFEPEIALFSPGDPLHFYQIIIESSDDLMLVDGLLAVEVGMGQASKVKDLMLSANFYDVEIIRDLAGVERIVTGRE
ncbi:MAG: peptide chain release factor N(5)-glutamine methyltransferase [candidate division Zixibacteria bacterium]